MHAEEQGSMPWGLTGSIAFHVFVALLAIGIFPHIEPDLPPIPPNIPIELVTIGEVTNIKQIDKVDETQKEEPKPEEPKPEEMRQAAIPPVPEAKPAPEPEPIPAPPPPPEAVPEPKPMPKAEPKIEKPVEVKPAQVAPPPKKEAAFDPSKVAMLLNKLPPKAKAEQQGEERKLSTGPQKTEAVGEGTAMTASWQALINEQFKRCWSVQAGAQDAEKQIVTVHVELNPDGSLARPPEIVNAAEVAMGGETFQVAAERALRAVRACSPLKQLPPDRYSDWHEMDFVFDPRRMLGG